MKMILVCSILSYGLESFNLLGQPLDQEAKRVSIAGHAKVGILSTGNHNTFNTSFHKDLLEI